MLGEERSCMVDRSWEQREAGEYVDRSWEQREAIGSTYIVMLGDERSCMVDRSWEQREAVW